MTHVPASAIADAAEQHLGDDGPRNTCMSNGPERWTREVGLPQLGTGSVSKAVELAKAGHNGYRYHEGTQGLSRGHIGVWTHEALGSADDEHVTVVTETQGALWRGIGSGTPSEKVARQPSGGGYNPKTLLRGYIVAPTESQAVTAPQKPVATKPAADAGGDVYVVRSGDWLLRIAKQHDTTVKRLLALNPARRDRRSADFHISSASHIEAGQKIRLP